MMSEKRPLSTEITKCYTPEYSNTKIDENTDPSEQFVTKSNVNCVVIFMCLSMAVYAFSLSIYALVSAQYSYAYLSKYLFPNSSDIGESNGSCNVNTTSENYQERLKVQDDTTTYLFYSSFADKVPSIIMGFFFGSLSDRYGRKVLLNIIFIGAIAQGLTFVFLMYFDMYVYFLLIATAVGSLFGGFFPAIALAFAYLSDITKAGKQRTLVIVFMEIGLGLGATLAGFVSGYLIEDLGFMYTMVLASGLLCLPLVFLNAFVEETRSKEIRRAGSLSENLSNIFRFFTQDISPTAKRWKYMICLSIFFASCLGILSRQGIDPLYQLNSPFCWDSVRIGWFAAARNLFTGVIGGASMKLFHTCTSLSDKYLAIVSSLSNIGACVLEALANTDIMLFLVPVVGTFGMLVIPIMRAVMSGMTPPDKQGSLYSCIAVVEMTAILACDTSSKAIYRETVGVYRGAVYLVFAGYNGIALILLLIFFVATKASTSSVSTKTLNIEESISVPKNTEV